MKLLTLEQLLALHVLAIQQGGGDDSIRDIGRLESVIAAQAQAVFSKELYPTVYEKAAVLSRNIIGDHPFVDGNKRTAMLSALTLLGINGYMFKANPGEIEDFAVQVAVEKLDVDQVTAWLKSHSTKT